LLEFKNESEEVGTVHDLGACPGTGEFLGEGGTTGNWRKGEEERGKG